MKQIFIPLTTLILASCFAPASSQSSQTTSLGMFDKVVDGKILLKETITNWTFLPGESKEFTGTALLPINYRNEMVSVPYEGLNADLGDFSDETISFNTQPPSINALLSQYASPQILNEAQTLTLLSTMLVTDEVFHQAQRLSRERNLSFDTLEGSYYAFNNYIREESIILQRYQTPMIYGEGEILITFQTGFELRPTVIEQISADSQYIYQLRDETFPAGFFGAVDRKISTMRIAGNFKQAMAIGPIRLILDRFIQAEKAYRPLQTDGAPSYEIRLQTDLQSSSQFQLVLEVVRLDQVTAPDYTYQLRMDYQNQGWSLVEEQERLFK
jgi:hypothetical protein